MRDLIKKAAMGAGAAGAILLGALFSSAQALEPPQPPPPYGPPAPAPVSAAASCFWQNPEPRYGVERGAYSHAEGEATCRNTGPKIKVRCHATIAMSHWYEVGSSHGRFDCGTASADIGIAMLSSVMLDNKHFGSRFIFWYTLRGLQYAWDGSAPNSSDPGGGPNRGCRVYRARVTGRSTMRCRHIHDDGVRFASAPWSGGF